MTHYYAAQYLSGINSTKEKVVNTGELSPTSDCPKAKDWALELADYMSRDNVLPW